MSILPVRVDFTDLTKAEFDEIFESPDFHTLPIDPNSYSNEGGWSARYKRDLVVVIVAGETTYHRAPGFYNSWDESKDGPLPGSPEDC